MNGQEVVGLLRDLFSYSDIRIVVYTFEENGVHALSSGEVTEVYAEDKIERYSEEFCLNDRDLETNFTRYAKSCGPICEEHFFTLCERIIIFVYFHPIEQYLQYQAKKLVQYVKEFDFQFPDIKDEVMTLLVDVLIDSRDAYSLPQIEWSENCRKFHVTLKPNVELKRQRPLHLKEKLEKFLVQLKDADIIGKTGDNDEMR